MTRIILYTVIYSVLTWTDIGGHSYLTSANEFKVFENEQTAIDFRREAKKHSAFIGFQVDTVNFNE